MLLQTSLVPYNIYNTNKQKKVQGKPKSHTLQFIPPIEMAANYTFLFIYFYFWAQETVVIVLADSEKV